MRRTFRVVDLEAEGVEAELFLNDVPLIRRKGTDGQTTYSAPCDHELVPGWNSLAVVIGPGPTPATALRGPRRRSTLEKARVKLRLVEQLEGTVSGGPDATELARIEWESPELVRPLWLPHVVSCGVDLGGTVPRWRWLDAPALTLDEGTRRGVGNLLEELHELLHGKDLDGFLARASVRTSELERAYRRRPGEKRAEILQAVQRDLTEDGWGLEPLEPEQWDLRLCARARMVDCVRKDGEPILRMRPRAGMEQRGAWPVRAARIDGAWAVVR